MGPRFEPVVLGGAGWGGLYAPASDEQVDTALTAAWECGVRAFDTAPHYGLGLSEERLGRFLGAQPRDAFVLSTKVGRLLVDDLDGPSPEDARYGLPARVRVLDYSAAGVRRSLAESLERLGLDRIDLALIHDPEDHLDQAIAGAAPALSALRSEGVIGGYGVGTNYADVAARLVAETDLDHVMIAGRWSLLDRRAGALLDRCTARGVRVLAAGTLNSGLLAAPRPDSRFDYAPVSAPVLAAARALEEACASRGIPLRAAALQYPTRHAAVAAVVLGASTAAEVRDSLDQLQTRIPDELWAELDTVVPDELR